MSDQITFEQFKQVEIRIGKVLAAEKIPDTDKLLKLQVGFGEFKRQIVSGIAESYTVEEMVGKSLPFIVNLEPRILRGEESQGMLMATGVEGKVILLEPAGDVPAGTEVV
jgi:methionine--tRNA ligase beta chain